MKIFAIDNLKLTISEPIDTITIPAYDDTIRVKNMKPVEKEEGEIAMWLPILGLILGVFLGLVSELRIPPEYSNYLSIAILAALDTLIGGIRAHLQDIYDELVFVSGFSLTSF